MKIKTFDYSNKKFGVTILESEVWKVDFSPFLISLYNRYTLLNRRRVISKTKIKSEVSGGGRKPWRQKGTGRARQGSIRSPQWKGGGVVFGPTGLQNYSVGINKKEKRKAVFSILSKKASQDELIIIENLNFENHKTNQAFSLIKDLDILNKNILFVTSRLKEIDNQKIEKSFRNIKKVSLIDSRRVDVHSILKSNFLIFTKDSISDIEKLAVFNKKDK